MHVKPYILLVFFLFSLNACLSRHPYSVSLILCFSNFLTISVDDCNSPGVLRMAFRNTDNINFPAHSPDSLLEAMEKGTVYSTNADQDQMVGDDCIGCGEVNIDCSWSSLAKAATDNPVSVALHYKKVIHDVLSILVGIRPGTTSGNNNRNLKTSYRGWGKDGMGVIVGTPVAFIGVTETTGRGSLHFHVGTLLDNDFLASTFTDVPQVF